MPWLQATRSRSISLVLCGACLAAAGCGGDEPSTVPTLAPTPTSEPVAPATEQPASPAPDPLAGASASTVTQPATNDQTALLRDVRAARQDGFDRLVFEFANALPGYRVGYVDRPITEDGSGAEVAVDGAQVLAIRLERASGFDLSDPAAAATYTGPARLTPPTATLTEVVRTGDFEGTLTWVAGVRERRELRVSTLTSPPRLIVDLRSE